MCKIAMYSAIIIITKHQHWICYFIIGKVNNKPTKLIYVSSIKYYIYCGLNFPQFETFQTTFIFIFLHTVLIIIIFLEQKENVKINLV